MEYATERRILSVWTVAFIRVGDDKVKILGFSRECVHGIDKEYSLPRCNMDEDNKRNVIRLYIQPNKGLPWANPTDEDTECLEVVNPEHIFRYGDCPEPKE